MLLHTHVQLQASLDLPNVRCIKADTRDWGIERKHICWIEAEEEANPTNNAAPYDVNKKYSALIKRGFGGFGFKVRELWAKAQRRQAFLVAINSSSPVLWKADANKLF